TDPGRGALVIDLAPLELPARTPHHALAQPPVATLEIPSDGYIHGFRVAVVDSAGRELSDELIHHFNLIDPDHRELFLPISRRLLAAGHETGAVRLPGLLIEFVDVTAGQVIYRAVPIADSVGHIHSVPISRLYGWTRLGAHIAPDHRYRVTVYYDNPTGQAVPDGGMGVVGGLFVPDRGVEWPPADRTDSLYQQDYRHYMRLSGGHEMQMPMRMGAHEHVTAHGHH